MKTINTSITDRAFRILRKKVNGKEKGYGVAISEALVYEDACEETRAAHQHALAAQKGASHDAWNTEASLDSVE